MASATSPRKRCATPAAAVAIDYLYARRDGWPFKLVCRAKREGAGVKASVAPEKVLASSPMAKISGSSSYLYFETDIFPGLALTEENPGLSATAYGMLADFVRSVRNHAGDS